MKLVMDLVVNHTRMSTRGSSSRVHPATTRSGTGTSGGIAREGGEPNNWGSFFGGSAWEWDQTTGQYYLHLFDRKHRT